MTRYVVIALMPSAPITYLYDDPAKALAKVRTLQRQSVAFELQDALGATMALSDLEKRGGSSGDV